MWMPTSDAMGAMMGSFIYTRVPYVKSERTRERGVRLRLRLRLKVQEVEDVCMREEKKACHIHTSIHPMRTRRDHKKNKKKKEEEEGKIGLDWIGIPFPHSIQDDEDLF